MSILDRAKDFSLAAEDRIPATLSGTGKKFMIHIRSLYKKPGMIYKGVDTPSIALDTDTTLIDFAASPTRQKAAWLLRKSVWPGTPMSQTQVTLLVQIGKQSPIRKIGSVTEWPKANYWPEANHNRDVQLHWSPDAKHISFVCHYAVYVMPVE